jgi:hypothetical protein
MTDESPPMKPQDTVIFLLGELGGKVTSLTDSVNSTAASQAAVNAANEAEHAKFREAISAHDTAIAVLNDGKKAQQENKLTRIQLVSLWIGAPSGLGALIALLAYINFNK